MGHGLQHSSSAVACGHWPLYRYDPRRRGQPGVHPLMMDSKPPSQPFADYAREETRYRLLAMADHTDLTAAVDADIAARWRVIEALAHAADPPNA